MFWIAIICGQQLLGHLIQPPPPSINFVLYPTSILWYPVIQQFKLLNLYAFQDNSTIMLILSYYCRLAQACSHIGGLLFAICNGVFTPSQGNDQSCTSTLCAWKMPRSVNQKPTQLSNLNLSKPHLEKILKDNVTATSPLPHGSSMANFDPRHSEDRKMTLTGPCKSLQNWMPFPLKQVLRHNFSCI